MKTPINKESIRQHFTYSMWKYILLVVIAIFGWNLIYSVTAYQPPKDKCIDMFIFGVGEETVMDAYMETVRTAEMTDMEEMDAVLMVVDETYTPMQLMAYIAAGEGHLYILPKDYFVGYGTQDLFVQLDTIPGLIEKLDASGVSYDRGWCISEETGEKHLYGIPLADFPGLASCLYGYQDSYLSISVTNGNDENSAKFLQIFLEDMLEPPVQVDLTTVQ